MLNMDNSVETYVMEMGKTCDMQELHDRFFKYVLLQGSADVQYDMLMKFYRVVGMVPGSLRRVEKRSGKYE